MTKVDLAGEVSRVVGVNRKDSEVIIETILEGIVKALRNGEKVEIRGFGSFRARQHQGRAGRNPKSGERVEVPPKKFTFFKPSKELRELVNGIPK